MKGICCFCFYKHHTNDEMEKDSCKKRVGMSLERSPGSIGKWKDFFQILGVDCIVSDLQPEMAAKKAEQVFKYCMDYCFFRKSCLGQYIDLIEKGIKTIVVPVKIKDSHLACNSSMFMATELAEYYKDITFYNASIYTSEKKYIDIRRIAESFSTDKETIEKAMTVWKGQAEKRKNVFIYREEAKYKKDITVMLVGKINHFFDYTDIKSPLLRYLTDKIGVKVIDPENVSYIGLKELRKGYKIVNEVKLQFKDNRATYWPEEYLITAIDCNRENLDGVIFIRDCYCNAGIEEINILQSIVKRMAIPSIIVNWNLESQSSIETSLETFVEMLEWKKRE